jgi:hypothetical protein
VIQDSNPVEFAFSAKIRLNPPKELADKSAKSVVNLMFCRAFRAAP